MTEPGFGGGPMSDKGSGEMDEVSELSRLRVGSSPLQDGRVGFDLWASSTSSLTSLGGIKDDTVAFRRLGFTMGDCRIRVVAVDARGALLLLLRNFRPSLSGCATAASPSMSTSTSAGDVPAELPEVVYWLAFATAWAWACWGFCAFKAGEVNGLKYAPGTVV